MPSYLVETYVPRAGEDVRTTGRRVRVAADEVRLAGSPIRYVRMTFVRDDET